MNNIIFLKKSIFIILFTAMTASCTPDQDSGQKSADENDPFSMSNMRAKFYDRCQNRIEYQSKKRAGTLDKHCKCIFDRTMRGLSKDEQRIAAGYLYGNNDEAFREALRSDPPDLDAMPAAVEAVGRAAQKCR